MDRGKPGFESCTCLLQVVRPGARSTSLGLHSSYNCRNQNQIQFGIRSYNGEIRTVPVKRYKLQSPKSSWGLSEWLSPSRRGIRPVAGTGTLRGLSLFWLAGVTQDRSLEGTWPCLLT